MLRFVYPSSMQCSARLFLLFRPGFPGGLETDLGVGAIAKRFLDPCPATAERHPFFDRKLVSVRVDQLHFAGHDVRTVLDCLDCYLSHGSILLSCRPKWRHL